MPEDTNVYADAVSDMPLIGHTERDLEAELFGKKGIKKVLDTFEETLGYPQSKTKKANLKYRNKIFSPGHSDDEELLNELINDRDRFSIVMWKDTWTVHGDLKIFIIYSENMDAKKPAEEEKNED